MKPQNTRDINFKRKKPSDCLKSSYDDSRLINDDDTNLTIIVYLFFQSLKMKELLTWDFTQSIIIYRGAKIYSKTVQFRTKHVQTSQLLRVGTQAWLSWVLCLTGSHTAAVPALAGRCDLI